MPTIQDIQAAASRHSKLLQSIAELDYAPSAFEQSTSYLLDLTARKEEADRALEKLVKKTEKEREEHLDIQNSVARKWANKLVGRADEFAERVTKEEREFLESIERENEGRGTAEKLTAEHKAAKKTNEELKAACEKRERLQREVAELYSAIFGGTSSEFPEEDEVENALRLAESENNLAQLKLNVIAQGLASLKDAAKAAQDCVKLMGDAVKYSRRDVWGFGGKTSDMQEAITLGGVQMLVNQVDRFVDQARRFDSDIDEVPKVHIPQTSFFDIFFDNAFTDLKMHEKIKTAQSAVTSAHAKLESEVRASENRMEVAIHNASQASEVLVRARRRLHDIREAMFLGVAKHGALPTSVPGSRAASSHSGDFAQTYSSTVPPSESGNSSGISQGSAQISMPTPVLSSSVASSPSGWESMNPYAASLSGKVKKEELSGSQNLPQQRSG